MIDCWSKMLLLAVLARCSGQQRKRTGPILSLTATTDNVSAAPDSIRINLLRWSTDAERDQLLSAWNLTAPATAPQAARPWRRGRQRRRFDRRLTRRSADVNRELPPVQPPAAAGAAAGAAAVCRGGGAPRAPRPTPEEFVKAALDKAPTVGYLWSSEVAGYSLRYAVQAA